MTDDAIPECLPGGADGGANAPQEAEGPSIGLALGGGVARGWAHIGAIERLVERGVPPKIVCGTSVGALVGGFWLAGELDSLSQWARALTKRRMLSYFDLMLTGSGLMGGKKLRKTMRAYLADRKIEDLPARFVAVTAEMTTGHERWLIEGDLADAIEAAYALPGVFPPRQIDGRWLIDGAILNPLPVSVCRAFGARLVIAVGLHADAFGRTVVKLREKHGTPDPVATGLDDFLEGAAPKNAVLKRLVGSADQTPGLGTVMMASFNIFMDRTTRSRLAGDPPDVLVLPEVGHIPLLDFDRADELIALGRDAIDAAFPDIERAMQILT
ncbi:MAG: patatin-like phospholipase family protein [Pseudomonadota bacterium]